VASDRAETVYFDQWQHLVVNNGDAPIIAIIVESKVSSKKNNKLNR